MLLLLLPVMVSHVGRLVSNVVGHVVVVVLNVIVGIGLVVNVDVSVMMTCT